MLTTIDLLDAVVLQKGPMSDYALAKLLGITRGAVSNYRVGRSVLDNEMCFRIAEILEFDPGQVVAWIEAERAQRAQREADAARWSARARKLAGVAAMLLAAIGIGSAPSPSEAAQSVSGGGSVYYVNRRRAQRKAPHVELAPFLAVLCGRWSRR